MRQLNQGTIVVADRYPLQRDTGFLVAGHEITQKTGLGIAGGAVAGYLLSGKKHRVIGTIAGIVGGFFAGRYLEDSTKTT